jgi:hypothetical protein
MEVADDDGGRRKDGDVVGQVPAGFVTGVGQGSMEIEARTEKEFKKIERKTIGLDSLKRECQTETRQRLATS